MAQQSHSLLFTQTIENCQRNNLHEMFMATLFTIAKSWKQPRSPSVGEEYVSCGTSRCWNAQY